MNILVTRRGDRTVRCVVGRALLCGTAVLAMAGAVQAEPLTTGGLAVNAAKAAVVNNVVKNFEGADREKNTVDKITKAVTGVSVDAIRKNGFSGGKNSIIRKPFG